ncbi:MAG: Ig-like domain-containing protein, partial [Clostridia bacterium]
MKSKKSVFSKIILIVLVFASILSLVSCVTNTENEPTSISITNKPTNSTMLVGDMSITLGVTIEPSEVKNALVIWTSSDKSVATVTDTGILMPLSMGTSTITAKIKDSALSDSFVLTVSVNAPNVNDLLNDLILSGVWSKDTPEVGREPLDPDYIKLLTRKEPLLVGESYTETFDKESFLDTKLYPLRASNKVTAGIASDISFEGSQNKVLAFDSEVPYGGVYLAGMQFVPRAKYTIEMDYNVLRASNTFYFQFRSYAFGAESDVFVTLPTSALGVGKLQTSIVLKDYADYEIMIFSGSAIGGGKIAIDNLKVTRQDIPQDQNTENFDTVTANMQWRAVGNASAQVSSNIPKNGIEKSLNIVTTMADTGVEFPLTVPAQEGVSYKISMSLKVLARNGQIALSLGNSVTLNIGENFNDNISVNIVARGNNPLLRILSSGTMNILIDNLSIKEVEPTRPEGTQVNNTQNFNTTGGMDYTKNEDADLTLTKVNLPLGGSDIALNIKANSAYGGVNFGANGLTVGDTYKVSFNVKLISNANGAILYIQLGGGGDFKEFDFNYPCSTYNAETGYVDFTLKANVTNQLQIFTSASGLEMIIDNVKIERVVLQSENTENFDDEPTMSYAVNNDATVSITEDSSLMPQGASKKALKVVSNAQYGGVVIVTSPLTNGAKYLVSFDIKVNIPNGSFIYIKLGGSGEAKRFDPSYTWNSPSTYSSYSGHASYTLTAGGNNIVMFANAGGVEFVLDNIKVELCTAKQQENLVEDFDGLSNIGVSSNGLSNIERTTVNLPQGATSNALLVEGKENYAGVALQLPSMLAVGQTYKISFNINILNNYEGAIYVQQLGKAMAFEFSKASIVNGKITGDMTVVSDNNTSLIQIFAGGVASFVIDNIEVVLVEKSLTLVDSNKTPFTSVEGEQQNIYAWASNGGSAVSVAPAKVIVTSTTEAYAGAYLRLPFYFEANKKYQVIFNTNATHGLYVNIDGGADTPVDVKNGRVSLVLTGVASKNVIRIFANNTANANYSISNLIVNYVGDNTTLETFDTWSNLDVTGEQKLAVAHPYSGANVPTITLQNGKLVVTSGANADNYGVYIKLDTVLTARTNYTITFNFEGEYSPYVSTQGAGGEEKQETPLNGVITV